MYNVDKTYEFDMFNSIDKIKNIDQNIMIIHGTKDEIISFEDGKYMFENLKKEIYSVFVKIENGTHNIGLRSKFKDCYPDIKEFICKTSNKNNICDFLIKNESRKTIKDISKLEKQSINLSSSKRNINDRLNDDNYMFNKLRNLETKNFRSNDKNVRLDFKNNYHSDNDLYNLDEFKGKYSEFKLFSFNDFKFKYSNKTKCESKYKYNNNLKKENISILDKRKRLKLDDRFSDINNVFYNSLEIDIKVEDDTKYNIDERFEFSSASDFSDYKLFDLKSKLFKSKEKNKKYFKSKKSFEDDESNLSIQEIELQLKIINEQNEIQNKNMDNRDKFKEVDLSKCNEEFRINENFDFKSNNNLESCIIEKIRDSISTNSFNNLDFKNEFINKNNHANTYPRRHSISYTSYYSMKSEYYDIMNLDGINFKILRQNSI